MPLIDEFEFFLDKDWSDGLPVVTPTEARVARMLTGTARAPDDLIGNIPPAMEPATVRTVAIHAVMAGCKPDYLPVVLGGIELMLRDEFNLNGVQTTTHACAPLVIVSGPAVKTLGFNTREGALGHGCRASATIGRALRLILWNIGGGFPGDPCKTTLGHPGYFTFCLAEDQEANPWEPLHVERGFKADDTVVTVTAVTAPMSVATGAARRCEQTAGGNRLCAGRRRGLRLLHLRRRARRDISDEGGSPDSGVRARLFREGGARAGESARYAGFENLRLSAAQGRRF